MGNPTFVLVHGAWHGGWAWKELLPRLRAAGADVYAPTLSGCAERAAQLSPNITLTTHIEDIDRILYFEDLSDVVLVGHSYGGSVISGVIERARERVRHAVWLDAFLPNTGESIVDMCPDIPLHQIAASVGDGYRIPCGMADDDFGIVDPSDLAWTKARLTDQPFGTFVEASAIAPASWDAIGTSYVLTSPERFPEHAARARDRGYAVVERTSWRHNSMASHPDELAEILLSFVSELAL